MDESNIKALVGSDHNFWIFYSHFDKQVPVIFDDTTFFIIIVVVKYNYRKMCM